MAKVFIILLGLVVVVNAMTLLVVVNQSPPEGGSKAGAAEAATSKKPAGPDPQVQRLDRIQSLIQDVKGSVDGLSRRMGALETKVAQASSRPSLPAPRVMPAEPATGAAATAGTARPGSRSRTIAPVRTGPADYSRLPNEAGSPPEPAGDETTNEEEAPATPPATPATGSTETEAPAAKEATSEEGAPAAEGEKSTEEGP